MRRVTAERTKDKRVELRNRPSVQCASGILGMRIKSRGLFDSAAYFVPLVASVR